ncbi:unnamed protein product [Mycena citricolor]|uniref:Major facilitator superfamily (MFS) profile domain-containing protein n=1 Tax=Mycena citricolor TaxID=2018698 RepID=A0AAD2H2Q8_9AGAR|nr:unnamed protein product [Mycena citricolor]
MLLVTIGIFEVGSLLCAVSPNVNVLIFGRVFAGVGASGLMVSMMYIIAKVTSIRQRPSVMSVFGCVYAIASIDGPLLGGVFSVRSGPAVGLARVTECGAEAGAHFSSTEYTPSGERSFPPS